MILQNGESNSAVATYIEQARNDSTNKGGGTKRPAEQEEGEESDEEPADEVRLHEDGWRDRYVFPARPLFSFYRSSVC